MASDTDAHECRQFSMGNAPAELRPLSAAVIEFLAARGVPGKTRFTVELVLDA